MQQLYHSFRLKTGLLEIKCGFGSGGLQGTKNIKVAGVWSWRAKAGAVSELSSAVRSTNVFVANITESNIQVTDTIRPKARSIYDPRGPGPAPRLLFLRAAVSPSDLTPRKKLLKKDIQALA